MPGRGPLVSILTFCAHPALAYGTLLIFKTLRVGFPTARIEVFDNGSHPEVLGQIARAAEEAGAEFHALAPRHYADHYRWLLLEREHDGPLVILDPDIALWENVEQWEFGAALLAGRLIPQQRDGIKTLLPRLHPSLLWVPDVARLRGVIEQHAQGRKAWDGIGPSSEIRSGRIAFADTFAPLYAAFPEQCAAFDEDHLDCYDHLFFGSHLPLMDTATSAGFEKIREGHRAAARGDLASLRGIWRQQQEYFSAGRAGLESSRERASRLLPSIKAIQDWQGLAFSDEQLQAEVNSLLFKVAMQPRARLTRRAPSATSPASSSTPPAGSGTSSA